jgi:hypothetical protein
MIPSSWILLDSQQSIVSVFKNCLFLCNIQQSPDVLKKFSNGGTKSSSFVSDTAVFGAVWFNPESLANILSMAHVHRLCHVTMDTDV